MGINRQLATKLALVALVVVGACTKKPELPRFDGYDPASTYKPTTPDGPTTPVQVSACRPVKAEPLGGRKALIAAGGGGAEGPTKRTVTRGALWADFARSCATASCHGIDPARGQKPQPQLKSPAVFTVDQATFHERRDLGTISLARVLSPNPEQVMPPRSTLDGSKRGPDDEFRILGELLDAWEDAGFTDSFEVQDRQPNPVPLPNAPGGREDPYRLNAELASALTNLGSCLPDPAKMERLTSEEQALDKLFAAAKSFEDLPATLAETDMVSLDSAVLARHGVFSYAPTYTLFSDHASKMRYVRVPVGKKITYNSTTKDFDIPPNTRFYKTFLRKVIDKNGEVGYRKMETRLIVARPDFRRKDGSYEVRSLMVVYAWDKDERVARKVTDPLNRQEPWKDRLCPYVTDETKARTAEKNPISPESSKTCTYMTEEEKTNLTSGQIRHYAIPSKDRCIQCHMGSNNHSFILGFTPWQVDRRKAGEGGVYEDPHEDELDQLKRLIDYGVIEGIAPGQAKLEESQGERKPRNDYELKAQGYMMGNCAFCHNPTGFPVVENPILKDFLLFPNETDGIFQFPLEKFSPRAKVGRNQVLRHPYITPSLDDFHPADYGYDSLSVGDSKVRETTVGMGDPTNDREKQILVPEEYNVPAGQFALLGPWRSLIWRNVYTPFTYAEDNTVFIHMPRNVPGFDCRAQRIMAEWMLSIPSAPKAKKDAVTTPGGQVITAGTEPYDSGWGGIRELSQPSIRGTPGHEQPFFEVKPSDQPFAGLTFAQRPHDVSSNFDYQDALAFAEQRLDYYRRSLIGQHCPDDEDIVDAQVVNSVGSTVRAPVDRGILNGPRVNPAAQQTPVLKDQVPDHAHWVPVDTTDLPGQWIPRRTDWKKVMVDRDPAVPVAPKVKAVIDELSRVYLTPERERFSTELVPMGAWASQCRDSAEASASPTVGQLQKQELEAQSTRNLRDMHHWLFDRDARRNPVWAPHRAQERVHSQSRGEAVFRAICVNCHGKDIDSRSPLAATIIELTGGKERVANFRDGLFGPAAAPGQYAENVFSMAGGGGSPSDWQARYMVFMAMGGTAAVIPKIAIELVSTSPFYGSAPKAGKGISDANMLESARSLCEDVLTSGWEVLAIKEGESPYAFEVSQTSGLKGAAHYELWSSICGFGSAPLIRVFELVNPVPAGERRKEVFVGLGNLYPHIYRLKDTSGRSVYPSNHPVGTFSGRIERGIQPSNGFPWCVAPTVAQDMEEAREVFRLVGITREEDMPFCPPALLTRAFGVPVHRVPPPSERDKDFVSGFMDAWTQTGAINAGVAAYYYLDGVTKGRITPQVGFDECKKP